MRVRETVTGAFDQEVERFTQTRVCSPGSSWTSPTKVGSFYFGKVVTKRIEDVKVPKFHSLLKCGKILPLNPVIISTVTEERLPGSGISHYSALTSCSAVDYTSHQWPQGMSNNGYVWSLPLPEVTDEMLTAVVNGAVADGRSAAWDVLTFLAEFEKTQLMFRTAVARYREYGRKVARASRRGVRGLPQMLKIASQLWLEYRYGWSPAFRDLQAAVEALQAKDREFAIGRARQNLEIDDAATYTILNSGGRERLELQESVVGQIAIRGWSAIDLSNPFTSQKFGADPLVTAWELIPFSFIADWFIQVGTWIEAVSPFTPGRTLGSCVSIKWEYTRFVTGVCSYQTVPGSGYRDRADTGQMGSKRESVVRYERYARSPSLPGWNPRLTPKRIIDAVALAYGAKADVYSQFRR